MSCDLYTFWIFSIECVTASSSILWDMCSRFLVPRRPILNRVNKEDRSLPRLSYNMSWHYMMIISPIAREQFLSFSLQYYLLNYVILSQNFLLRNYYYIRPGLYNFVWIWFRFWQTRIPQQCCGKLIL